MPRKFTFLEFFAGGGMARAGLGPDWRCLFANDFDAAKARAYRANWGDGEFRLADIHALAPADLPGAADLAWASFPCQDLSLAGAGAGLDGARSGAFWGFWRLMDGLGREGRAPRLLVLENVTGAITSRGGADFAALCSALQRLGYVFGALTIDAAHFVPQSRPRLFFVATLGHPAAPIGVSPEPAPFWASDALKRAHARLDPDLRQDWRWWRLPPASRGSLQLQDIIETVPRGVEWRRPEQTARLVELMAPAQRVRLRAAQSTGGAMVGALCRRTRRDASGARAQRAEVRFDGLAGCLRTPGGGSSRQFLLFVEGDDLRSRLISPREAARLMGLPDDFALPGNANAALHLLGDGVAAPVVAHLARHLLAPLLRAPMLAAAE